MKAQVSMEFLIVIIVLFVILVISTGIHLGITENQQNLREYDFAKFNAAKIANGINLVNIAGNGTTYNVSVSLDHNYSFHNRSVVAMWDNKLQIVPVLTSNVEFSEISNQTNVQIQNLGGIVYVS